ncbi:hypothetical protein [Streptomyces sp. NPDC060184]|uniref:hypothetical protein n=1 Tax=Streptomyces sp. NPDC060184 TaxID=3347064 RepID=UPI003661CC65
MSIDADEFTARLKAERNDPAREERLRQDRRKRRRTIGIWAGAGVVLAGGFTFWLVDVTSGERPAEEPFAAGALNEALWPDSWPATTSSPFRGSPASGWDKADEDWGMPLPPVHPVDGLGEEQVTSGLGVVRDFLRETNVSDEVLLGEVPEKALALLAPDDPARTGLETAVAHPTEGRSPLEAFTRFDPEEVLVLGGVRDQGSMTYEAAPGGGLLVHADYTFVYAVTKPEDGWEVVPGRPEAARVVVRRRLTATVREGKLLLGPAGHVIANTACPGPDDGFIHPLFYKERAKVKGGKEFDPYADGATFPEASAGVCLRPTRT